MRPFTLRLAFGIVATLLCGVAIAAQRTFVAAAGSDANPCSIAMPCRGFATAMTQTTSGGEIIVLDSAGYGPVAITKSVAIIAPPGVYAGITVPAGPGISISGASVEVTLRGLTINLQGGSVGIDVLASARLVIDRVTIVASSPSSGIVLRESKAALTNVRLEGGNVGITVGDNADATISDTHVTAVANDGIRVAPSTTGATARAEIVRTIVDQCPTYGITVDGTHGAAQARISESYVVENLYGIDAFGGALVYVIDSHVSANQYRGINQDGSAAVVLSGSTISANGDAGVRVVDAGYVYTMKNNVIRDNLGGNIVNGPLAPLSFD